MYALTVIFSVVTAALFAFVGVTKLTGAEQQVEAAEHFGIRWDGYRLIGVAELLGALGLLIGLGVVWLGVLAAACLLLLMAGALFVHHRSGDSPALMGPAAIAAVLALCTLIFRLIS
ncbi:DoxX family protein [Spirillospora sp. NBC_01491]|uniref:DoxX family protein n=1 Tax=Spirillospora sp. NBC_01491 TaxID=2976007 RepID=UPI002E32233C|nr:DoxX family protein [Spirillospora sp. NBC_01491]